MAKDRKLAGSKVGRRPQGEFAGKRAVLSTRITQDLRDRLEHAKKESGRSLSQEIELRLEQSFSKEDAEYGVFGDRLRYRQMQLLAIAINLVEEQTGGSWQRDYQTYREVHSAMKTFFKALGPRVSPIREVGATPPYLGKRTVEDLLKAVKEITAQKSNNTEQR